MTGDKMRALVLSALMVLSVFAGTIALTGTAAAANSDVASATEFNGTIEVALEGTTSTNVDYTNVDVYVDGVNQSVTASDINGDTTTGPASINVTGLGDLDPVEDVTITISDDANSGVSVDNMSVTTTGGVLKENGDKTFFKGTTVAYVAGGADTTFELQDNSGDRIRERGTGPNSQIYVIDTSDQALDQPYFVNETATSGGNATYTLDSLGQTADLDTTEIDEGDSVTATATQDVTGRTVEFRLLNSDGEIVQEDTAQTGSSGSAQATFTVSSAGNYTITAVDATSGVSSTAGDLTVNEVAAGDVTFAQTVASQERGDILYFDISFTGDATDADLEVGSGDVNFFRNFSVSDVDGDGTVTVAWNTGGNNLNNSTSGMWAVGDDTLANQTAPSQNNSIVKPPETGEYPASVQLRGQGGTESVATIVVEERSTTSVTTHTAPASATPSNVSTALDVASSAEVGNTVALDATAGNSDWVLVNIQSSGLSGYIKNAEDITRPGGTNGVSVSIVEDDATVGPNQGPIVGNTSVLFTAPGEDQYILALKKSDFNRTVKSGDQFTVTFNVDASASSVTGEDETVTASFAFETGTVSVDTQGEKLFLPADEQAQMTGTSNFAPGTSLTVTLRSTGGTQPFSVQNNSVVVQEDGTWTATFDLSEQADGQEFTAKVRKAGSNRAELSGQIGSLSASVSFSNQEAQDAGTLVTVDSATLSDGGFVAIHLESATGPVIGVSDYLEAGSHSNIQIRLDQAIDGETTLVAMPHKDTNNNQVYEFGASEGEKDTPYTSGGAPVTDDATVTIPTPTPTEEPTDTPTEEPTDTPTEEPTEMTEQTEETEGTTAPPDTETTSPGFGLIVALLALAGAALLALRRD